MTSTPGLGHFLRYQTQQGYMPILQALQIINTQGNCNNLFYKFKKLADHSVSSTNDLQNTTYTAVSK